MEKINRLLTNICSDKLPESKHFYTKLFNFNVGFESDWFIQLVSPEGNHEIGIIERTNELVPESHRNQPTGFYVTFVVDNVDTIYDTAKSEGFEVISKPTDTFYGQRRLLLKDPNGSVIDVSALIKA